MFTIQNPEDLIEKIDQGLNKELAEIAMILPDVKHLITKKMLWSIYCNTEPYQTNSEEVVLKLPYSFIQQARSELLKASIDISWDFFPKQVEQELIGKQIIVTLNRYKCEAKVDVLKEDNTFKVSSNLKAIIALSLPDSHEVFESLITGDLYSGEANTWLYEYMDQYDSWKYEVMSKLHKIYIQIGGHGRWIQSDYNGSYIGQVNNDIGDAGSVFVEVRNNEFLAQVDMF